MTASSSSDGLSRGLAVEDFKELNSKEESLLGLTAGRLPETTEEGELAEQILLGEMETLSLAEHEKVAFDVHGIASPVDETPGVLNEKLEQMERHLQKIRRKQAYELAKYMNKSYVTDRSRRIMFLRGDYFDAKLSAQRIVRHFEVKRALFGDGEVLGRDVVLADLNALDMRALESGYIQVLPSRDSSGRPVFSMAPMFRPAEIDVINGLRALWYLFMTMLKDEETQTKGAVGVYYNVGVNSRREPLSVLRRVHYARTGIPKRIAGMHYCYDDKKTRPFIAGLRLFLDKAARSRFRTHFGSRAEISFGLQTYGIPTHDHPILPDGKLNLTYHKEWLQVRRAQETQGCDASMGEVLLPRRFDVLFGRGKSSREHTGNFRAMHLVEMHRHDYEKAGKLEKTEIAERIVGMIQESYGRFLKWEANGWVEVDHAAAREKVSHFFRQLRCTPSQPRTTSTNKCVSNTK